MVTRRQEIVKGLKRRVNARYQRLMVSDYLARRALEALLHLIIETVNQGEEVRLDGLGTFYLKTLRPKKARHFPTGKIILLPERKRPSLRPSKKLLRRLLKE